MLKGKKPKQWGGNLCCRPECDRPRSASNRYCRECHAEAQRKYRNQAGTEPLFAEKVQVATKRFIEEEMRFHGHRNLYSTIDALVDELQTLRLKFVSQGNLASPSRLQ